MKLYFLLSKLLRNSFKDKVARVCLRIAILTGVSIIIVACAGCLPKINPTTATQSDSLAQQQTPLQLTLQFVSAHEQQSWRYMFLLNFDAEDVIELDGAGSLDSGRAYWRDSRNEYEQIRFAVEQFVPALHYLIAAWFTDNPSQGFHYIEKFLFVPNATLQSLPLIDYPAELIQPNLAEIPTVLDNFANDSGVFQGMLFMLADIDSLKLSGMDSAYSNNSYNDIFSNYNGLDTVYGYYRPFVQKQSPAADSSVLSCLQSARLALTQAGSIAALDKPQYRTQYLYPLETAVKRAWQAIASIPS